MNFLRVKMRLPVTLVMFICTFSWSLQSHASALMWNASAQVMSAALDSDTRVIRLIGVNATETLKPGMAVTGTGIPEGSYIVQILSSEQILINQSISATNSNTPITFQDVTVISEPVTGAGNYVKNGTDKVVLVGSNTTSGSFTINDGVVQVGGVNFNGRTIIHDVLSNTGSLIFGTTGAPTLNFSSNVLNTAPFERVGSISGGSDAATILLTGGTSNTALAFGGNNATTTFTGSIIGGVASTLMKEGDGTFTWVNNNDAAFRGAVIVESGNMIVSGSAGLGVGRLVGEGEGSSMVLSNKTGATLTLASGGSEVVGILVGGGYGTTRLFPNGSTGALLGNYLGQNGGELVLNNTNLVMDNNSGNQVYSFGGVISGTGNFTKVGNNTFEVLGISTYLGDTRIQAFEQNNTNSAIRLGAYGLNSGIGQNAASGYGALPSTTRLILSAGQQPGTNRNVTFDLNGGAQTLGALISQNVVGIKNVELSGGVLTIHTTTGVSGFYDGIFSGRGTINVTSTIGANGWELRSTDLANSNNTQRGSLNIMGGRVTLNDSRGALGDNVKVNITGAGQLSVLQNETIGSLSGNGSVLIADGVNLAIASAPAGSILDNAWTGTITGTGTGGLIVARGGSLNLKSDQNFAGTLRVVGGSALYLDYSAGATNLIPGGLNLNGGSIILRGGVSPEAIGGSGTTLSAGSSLITTQTGEADALFNLGIIQRNSTSGGAILVKGASARTASVGQAGLGGILGGYAVHREFVGNSAVFSWAVPGNTGAAIHGLANLGYSSSFGAGLNTDVTSALNGDYSGATGSLRFNQFEVGELRLKIGGVSGGQQTIIESGGILMTPSFGARNAIIEDKNGGGEELLGGGAFGVERELIVHQYNTRGSLTIAATIADNGGASRLTKTGPGTLILTKNNTFTGQVGIYGGVLRLSASGTLGSSQSVVNQGYLEIDRASFSLNQLIEGTGTLRKSGSGTLSIGGNNSYTGPTQILQGMVDVVNTNNGLGSVEGLTSVGAGATLRLSSVVSPETVVLKAGTLATGGAGASTLNGALYLRGSSAITLAGASAPLTLNGRVSTTPGSNLSVSGTGGRLILSNASNEIGQLTLGSGVQLIIGGEPSAPGSGSLGRANIINNGSIILNMGTVTTNPALGQFVVGNAISGTGNLIQMRNTVYLTSNNTYTGTTLVGGNLGVNGGVIGLANNTAELRIGMDTYTGSVGAGAITVQAATNANSTLRYHLARNVNLANTINLNPFSDGTNARNASFIRQGTGTVELSGVINAGSHTGNPQSQRAILQTQGGGRLVISGALNNGANNSLNIINNGFVTFEGGNDYDIWGIISGNNALVFRTSGTTTIQPARELSGTPAQSLTSTSNTYLQLGTLVINNDFEDAIHDDQDIYILRGATLQMNYTETVGSILSQKGSSVLLADGANLTMDDGITRALFGGISGNADVNFSAVGAAAWYGLFGESDFTGNVTIGSLSQITSVRVGNLANIGQASALGAGNAINLGVAGSTFDSRLEYVGYGHSTNRQINLTGGASTVRISANGRGALILNGDIVVTAAGAKTLMLHGQSTMGNTINGIINDNGHGFSLVVNPNVGNNDLYGAGKWTLTNSANSFSGDITVALGILELAGNLGNGSGVTSVMGDLTRVRKIDLGTNNFDGRRYAFTGGGDNLGGVSGLGSTGTILFNDSTSGTATFGSNITFTTGDHSSTTNAGHAKIVNDGNKIIVIQGNLTSGAGNNRNWYLGGTNSGQNTVSGIISNAFTNGEQNAVISVIKEGAGTWRLSGNNTFTGAVTITNGVLELAGGNAVSDGANINLSNAGSDGSSVAGATLRIVNSEIIGSLQGVAGTFVEIADGQLLTLASTAQTYGGVISGAGGLVRTNNDGTARIQTQTNLNTYSGQTVITTINGNIVANRLDVLFLANGGSASGIGAASSDAANLILDTKTGNGGLRWIGATHQSTNRLFTIGEGAGAANIWADGQLFGDFSPAISFTNTGALAFLASNTSQTLTLRGGRIANNEFSPQINNNGTGITELLKIEAGMWILKGDNTYTGGTRISAGTLAVAHSNALGTGTVTVAGGAGIGLQLRDGVTISNNINNTVSLGGLSAFSGNNQVTGQTTLSGTNANWVVTVAKNATLNISGPITGSVGSGRLVKADQGTLILSGTNTFTGITSLAGGTTILNYDELNGGSNTSKLANSSALTLGFSAVNTSGFITGLGGAEHVAGQTSQIAFSGARLVLRGGTHNEVVSATTILNGANRIEREGGSTATLAMGTITRTTGNGVNDYGTLDFGSTGIASITNAATNNILVVSSAFATVDGTHWAVPGAPVSQFTAYTTANATTAIAANTHTNLVASRTQGAVSPYTLRFLSASDITLTLTGTLGLVHGGILIPRDMENNVTITGASIQRSANTTNLDTVIHHHGTGTLTILSNIVNNTNPQALTKTGAGDVVLGGANTYTGRVSIQQGVLQVGDGTALTANAKLGSSLLAIGAAANPVTLSDGAVLRINVANSDNVYTSGALLGGGMLHLAPSNTSTFMLVNQNTNWQGQILLQGGVLQVRGNFSDALGSIRSLLTIEGQGRLDFSGVTATVAKRIVMNDGAVVSLSSNSSANSTLTLSGTLTINASASSNAVFQVNASQALTVTGMIRSTNGFTKSGVGLMTLSANQFQEISAGAQAGSTTANINPAMLGQVLVSEGQLYIGNARALGATGLGNDTRILSGATLDLRGQALNWADVEDPMREVIRISGNGLNGSGALRNSTGTGVFSHLVLDTDALIVSGGYAVNSRLVLDSYDTNPNTGSVLAGNFTRIRPTIDGNDKILSIRGNSILNDATGAGFTLRDPMFSSPLRELVVNEGVLRIEKQIGPVSDFNGIQASNITNGIRIAYAGQSFADPSNQTLGLGPIMGARLNLWNNWDMHHTVNITMDGVLAASNGGHNSIDVAGGTIPNSTTYLDGGISLLGPAIRNFFNIDSSNIANNALVSQSVNNNTVVEQGNMTAGVQAKVVVRGQISGSGGLTKTGTRELRLTADNTFTGDLNVLRSGFTAARFQDNTTTINGVSYQTYGDAESWAEWGLTLAGANARISAAENINLQRRGMITLDNTNALDITSKVSGANHDDRIHNSANLNFDNGWLRIIGGNANNYEALATTGGSKLNLTSGSSLIDLMPTVNGTHMTLTIGEIARAPGSVLTLRNLNSTFTFGSSEAQNSVRVLLNTQGSLTQVGSNSSATSLPVLVGIFGGSIPHTLFDDTRSLGFNNANASDEMTQARNLQFLAGSHFMTYQGGVLRPLDDSEYFTPSDGLLDSLNGSIGQNVNLTETFTRVRENVTINALRFGPLSDNNGSGGAINSGTTLTSYVPAHNIQLYVDGTLNISSGMISSAYFTAGNATSLTTLIVGGTLNFGNREAIINNQNGMVRFTDGVVATGNLEIRSAIAGNAGLIKTGISQVVLDGANTYRGLTTISNGTLFLRNGQSALGQGGAGNGVVIEGNGGLVTGSGIQVGTPSSYENILVKNVSADVQVMRVDNDTTSWYSNLIIDNVDMAGLAVQTPRVSAANTATSIIHGNIYGGSTPITHNVNATLSRIVQVDAANNVMIFKGQFGDKSDLAGNAIPISDVISSLPSLAGTRTNQNEVLRVTLAGSIETNFFMERQYNAVGRLTLNNGNMIITYDPAAAGNDGTGFWTNASISRIPGADSATTAFATNTGVNNHGFTMALGSLFLTRPDQHFNMSTWNLTGNGAKFIGGLNTSGTVVFGTPSSTGNLTISNSASSTTTAPARLYAMSGGTVIMDMRLVGNPGNSANLNDIGVFKIGRGTVILANSTQNTAATSTFLLSGGSLVVDHAGQNVARLGATDAILNGGVLRVQSNLASATIANYATTSAVNNVLQLRSGGTEVIAESRGQDMTLNLGNNNANASTANLTRDIGAAINFVLFQNGGGNPTINLNFNDSTTALTRGDIIPWATFSTTSRVAEDFAINIAGTGATSVASFGGFRPASHIQNSISSWGTGMNVSETGTGFTGSLAVNREISTIRFNTSTTSQVSLNSGITLNLSSVGVAGAILVSSNTGTANKTISGGTLTSSTPELIFHQYGLGVLDVNSRIAGNLSVTLSGPSTTGEGQIGSTGTVRFAAGNTYSGRTIVSGAVLEFGSVSALGMNPTDVANDHLTLSGGSIRWTGTTASLQNRGVLVEGNGGVIDVVNPDGNLIIGTTMSGTQAGLTSQDVYRGDLIKTGAGSLTLLGAQSGFNGLLDIREGTLIAMADVGNTGAGTVSLLGGTRSLADGTILRQGANIQIILGNANNGGDWTLEEHFVFEGGNVFTYGGLLDVNANLASAGALDGQFNVGNRRPLNLNGMLQFDGAVQFNVTNNGVLRLGNSGGYISGNGDIIKDGPGQLHFRTNTPDWNGNLVIREGAVYAANQADVLGRGHMNGKTITLGDTERQGLAELLIQNPDNINGSWIYDVNHDIHVVYNPVQTKRIGIDGIANGNRATFHGDVIMNDNLILLARDVGISAGGEQAVVNFNGNFRDGAITSGNLLIETNDSNTTVNDLTDGRTYGYVVLNGDNSAWTGDVTVSSNLVYNQDNTAILRLGNSKALTQANEVVMNYNSILQAGGNQVTIGGLATLGGGGAFYGGAGTMSSNLYGSSEIIENAASTVGTLRIHQSTPSTFEAVWDAFFRDGTLNSQFLAPGANVLQQSAALNVVKAGAGWATLSLQNDYSGSTVVEAGILQVGKQGVGSTGRVGALGTTVQAGAVIAGSGVVQGRLQILAGGTLKPGDLAGNELGTLSVNGDAIFASGSQALMQIRLPSYNNPGAVSATDPLYATWRNGVPTDTFANALADLVTTSQHDMLLASGTINWGVGSSVTLVNDGYTPKAGDVFRLFSASGYLGALNVGSILRVGNETGTDINLFALGGNFLWDTSLFNSHGILMVVEADSLPFIIPPPVIVTGPTRTPATGVFEPGQSVTLNVSATGSGTLVYQWYLDGAPVAGANQPTYQFTANFSTRGSYTVSVTNDAGLGATTISPTSVLVEVNAVPFITVHPTPRTVDPGQNISFSVLASGQSPFQYQWLKDGEEIEGETNQTLVLENVLEFDEGVYSVIVKNDAGQAFSNGAALVVNDRITFAVASYTPFPRAYLGEAITFSVIHDGSPRVTGQAYSYAWRKNGVPISGATSVTFTLPNANLMMEGSYDVLVSNNVNTFTSEPVVLTLLPPVPVVDVSPIASQTLLAGEALNLTVQASGRPPLSYTWRRGTQVVATSTSNTLVIPNASVADAGLYVCEVSNSTTTKALSGVAEVVIVDSRTRITPVGIGQNTVLTANLGSGPATPIGYQWYKNGEPMTEEEFPDIVGIRSRQLLLNEVTLEDDGFYTCEIKGPAENFVIGCPHDVKVFTDAPLLPPFTFTSATIFADYQFQIPYDQDRTRAPSSIVATGLPPGLTLDGMTGIISGRPTRFKKGGYLIKVTVSNSYGSVQRDAILDVQDLSLTQAGEWMGLMEREPTLTEGLGGRLDFRITALAAYTGKLVLGNVSYSFKGVLDVAPPTATIRVTIPRRGRPLPPPLVLTLTLRDNQIVGGSVSDGVVDCDVTTGWRLIWGPRAPAQPASAYLGYHTFGLALPAGDSLIGNTHVPQGSGYGAFTVAANGKLRIAGRMPDGEALTSASFLGNDGGIGVFQTMYRAVKPGGSLLAVLEVDALGNLEPRDNLITSRDVSWTRPVSSRAADRTYARGFGVSGSPVTQPVELTAVGGFYSVPDAKNDRVLLDLPMAPNNTTNNVHVAFSDAGDLETALTRWSPNMEFSIGKGNRVTVPRRLLTAVPPVNPTGTTFSGVVRTGLISGGFSLEDRTPVGYSPPSVVKRAVRYQGMIIRDNGRWVGVGYFLLPQLPQRDPFTTTRNSPILSGLVLFDEL